MIDCYQYYIRIYNCEKKLIMDALTDGFFMFDVPYCGIYYFF